MRRFRVPRAVFSSVRSSSTSAGAMRSVVGARHNGVDGGASARVVRGGALRTSGQLGQTCRSGGGAEAHAFGDGAPLQGEVVRDRKQLGIVAEDVSDPRDRLGRERGGGLRCVAKQIEHRVVVLESSEPPDQRACPDEPPLRTRPKQVSPWSGRPVAARGISAGACCCRRPYPHPLRWRPSTRTSKRERSDPEAGAAVARDVRGLSSLTLPRPRRAD